MTRSLALILLAVVALGAVSQAVVAEAPIEGRTGRAEVRFMEGMIDHHQMALDMAQECLSKASSEAVLELCQNIIDAQTAEIETLQGWLLAWYNVEYTPVSMMEAMEAMDEMPMGDGPVTDPAGMMGMMAGLHRLEGEAYETAFLEAMVDHHCAAIDMATRILERAEHADLIEMANTIIEDQTAEIEYIETLLAS